MSRMQPLTSVVIPTRDRMESLRRAVNSVLDQGLESFEVVVVDDGSKASVEDELCIPDDRIRIIRCDPSGGPAVARNRGVSEARGQFVAFLDDDDFWLPGKIGACLACFERFPDAGAVFHHSGVPKSSDEPGGCTYFSDPLRRMLLQQPPHLNGVMVRRSIHKAVPFDEGFGAAEDLDYLIRLAQATPMVELYRVYATIGQGGDSLVGIDARIQGRKLLRQKHAQLFRDRRALAFWYIRIGHLYRRGGYRMRSLVAFARSAFLAPKNLSAWKGLILGSMPNRVAQRLLSMQ